ncbi:MAG TPA: MFS transporter [Candidatus Sulfotelmatobacter sp.]|nr:MFS transporter [Candidatus Sulfotelmatobacter sp.]
MTSPLVPADPPLRANRDFLVVLSGQGASALGDAVSFTAVPLLVFGLTGSGLAMGLVGALQTLPDFVLGLPIGALADRWDRRRLMMLADSGRALLTACIPLAYLAGLPVMPVVYLVMFPLNALRVAFMAGWTASVPILVGPTRIGAGSSTIEAVANLGFIVGPALAGVAVGLVGPGPTIAIDALSFAISAASLTLVRRSLRSVSTAPRRHLASEMLDGVRFLAGEHTLRMVLFFYAATALCTAAIIPALTIYVEGQLGLGAVIFGLILSAYSVGAVIGALAGTRLMRGSLAPLLLGGAAVTGVLLVVLALVGLPVVLIATALGAGVSQSLITVSYVTLRASLTPHELLGRVGSTARIVTLGLQPVGLLVGGVALQTVGGATTLLAMGALMLVAAAAFSLSATMRRARTRLQQAA